MAHRSTAIAILAFTGTVFAQTGPTHVFCSNGMRAVIEELRPQCERTVGHAMEFKFGSTTDLVNKINSGAPFDLAILTTDAIDRLGQSGKVAILTRADIARCGVGVGIRAGSAKPDIRTPEAMKAALLKAKAVTYAEDGASRTFVENMEQTFGIADQMKAKTVLTHGSGAANQQVLAGKADMVLTLGSEILPVPGMQLIGPLPSSVQGYVNFAAAASAQTEKAAAAKAIIEFLKSSAAAPVYKAKGMEA